MENHRPDHEFDIMDFLEIEFMNVSIDAEPLESEYQLWKAVYVVMFGVNEIARYHSDSANLVVLNNPSQLQFRVQTSRHDLVEKYKAFLEAAIEASHREIFERRMLPTQGDDYFTDHETNLDIINKLVTDTFELDEFFTPPSVHESSLIPSGTIMEVSADVEFGRLPV